MSGNGELDIVALAEETVKGLMGLTLDDVEDIRQEVALRLCEKRDYLEGVLKGKLRVARAMARNRMIDCLRRRGRDPVQVYDTRLVERQCGYY